MRLTQVELEEVRALISHDLKTPLTVIIGYAELLLAGNERARAEAPAQILEASRRLSADLDRLVDRLVSGESPMAVAPASFAGRPPLADGSRKILLVDDDAPLRRLLRLTLPVEDFDVLEAADGEEALKLVERERPDLVVLDWKLPVRSGAEVLAELAGQPNRPRVMVLTALGEADPDGADALLLKPFSPVELLDVIDRLLSGEAPERS